MSGGERLLQICADWNLRKKTICQWCGAKKCTLAEYNRYFNVDELAVCLQEQFNSVVI